MARPLGLFLDWEADLYLNYLKKPLSAFHFNIPVYQAALEFSQPLTVDHFRADAGLPLHPDTIMLALLGDLPGDIKAAYPLGRGSAFVSAAPSFFDSDSVIPDPVLVQSWNELWLTEKAIQTGGRTREQMAQSYAKLYAAASAAAERLNQPLE